MKKHYTTIVTYHYIRNIEFSKYNSINALNINNFDKQIKYFKKNISLLHIKIL